MRTSRKRIALLTLGLALFITISPQLQVNAQTSEDSRTIRYSSSLVEILPADLEISLRGVLDSIYPEEKGDYAIGYVNSFAEWRLISVAIVSPDRLPGETIDILIIAKLTEEGWQVLSENNPDFSDFMDQLPEEWMTATSKNLLRYENHTFRETLPEETRSSTRYKFPWPAGIKYYYATGWHTGYGTAIDVGTTGNDRRIIASASGVITKMYVCPITTRLIIRDSASSTIGYVHLETATVPSKIKQGVEITQGQYLGKIKRGSFSETVCGYATQNNLSAHLHWVVPTGVRFRVDGWHITYPDNRFFKPDGSYITPPHWTPVLLSTNELYVPEPEYTTNCGGTNVIIGEQIINWGESFNCGASNSLKVTSGFEGRIGSNIHLYTT